MTGKTLQRPQLYTQLYPFLSVDPHIFPCHWIRPIPTYSRRAFIINGIVMRYDFKKIYAQFHFYFPPFSTFLQHSHFFVFYRPLFPLSPVFYVPSFTIYYTFLFNENPCKYPRKKSLFRKVSTSSQIFFVTMNLNVKEMDPIFYTFFPLLLLLPHRRVVVIPAILSISLFTKIKLFFTPPFLLFVSEKCF